MDTPPLTSAKVTPDTHALMHGEGAGVHIELTRPHRKPDTRATQSHTSSARARAVAPATAQHPPSFISFITRTSSSPPRTRARVHAPNARQSRVCADPVRAPLMSALPQKRADRLQNRPICCCRGSRDEPRHLSREHGSNGAVT